MKKAVFIIAMALIFGAAPVIPSFAQVSDLKKGMHEAAGHAKEQMQDAKDAAGQVKEQMQDAAKEGMHEAAGHAKEQMQDAKDSAGQAKEQMQDAAKEGMHTMEHSAHLGALIHESVADGFQFAYHLIDMKEKMKDMKDMPEMKNTHHLMLYIKGPEGHDVEKGKVGYLLEGPGDSKQKTMAMFMEGGFGGDVNLKEKGSYTIKTKASIGEKTLTDQFTYEVK